MLAILTRPIGFFGQTGIVWFFLGLIFIAVVIAILFKICKLLLPALGVTEPWAQIIYWILVLFCVVLFFNYAIAGWF
jgi:hypothetical protein